jgi:hypothetical protein
MTTKDQTECSCKTVSESQKCGVEVFQPFYLPKGQRKLNQKIL